MYWLFAGHTWQVTPDTLWLHLAQLSGQPKIKDNVIESKCY